MKSPCFILIFTAVLFLSCKEQQENQHYFSYQNKPALLITSAEHYGAIMNAAFNYELYLETLNKEGFNYTRIFIGPYSEMGSDNFGITSNTMDPQPGEWITPWLTDRLTGKYNLNQWNPLFFDRLRDFLSLAYENDIIVEITLFTSYYVNSHWMISPFHARNNINQVDSIPLNRANTLYNGGLIEYQEEYVRKIVQETNDFQNIFFEVQNEPWSDNPNLAAYKGQSVNRSFAFSWQKKVELANEVSREWQRKITSIIADEEKKLLNKHLIAQNMCNFGCYIQDPDTLISIYNFHYADPEASYVNLDKPVAMALDETGFMPHNSFAYRSQAWKFILAGGAIYNNLDYSFTTGKENGTNIIDERTPGWGGPEFRGQLKILKAFIDSFDFIRMVPRPIQISGAEGQYEVQVLAVKGDQYAAYIDDKNISTLPFDLPHGIYEAEWIDPASGKIVKSEVIRAVNLKELNIPPFKEDIALRVIKKK